MIASIISSKVPLSTTGSTTSAEAAAAPAASSTAGHRRGQSPSALRQPQTSTKPPRARPFQSATGFVISAIPPRMPASSS
jgi:hypothetical protein